MEQSVTPSVSDLSGAERRVFETYLKRFTFIGSYVLLIFPVHSFKIILTIRFPQNKASYTIRVK